MKFIVAIISTIVGCLSLFFVSKARDQKQHKIFKKSINSYKEVRASNTAEEIEHTKIALDLAYSKEMKDLKNAEKKMRSRFTRSRP